MNILLEHKYKNTNEHKNDKQILILLDKINYLILEEFSKFNISNSLPKNLIIKNLEEKIKPILFTLEESNKDRVNVLMSNVQLIKTKVEKLQKENTELIYMKDENNKLYENEKLNKIILEKRNKIYKEENKNLSENLDLVNREKDYLKNLNEENKQNKYKELFNDEILNKNENDKNNFNNNYFNLEVNNLNTLIEEYKIKLENQIKINFENSQSIKNKNIEIKLMTDELNLFYLNKTSYEDKINSLKTENKNLIENLNKLSLTYYNYDEMKNINKNELNSLKADLNYKISKISKLEKSIQNFNTQLENKNNLIEELTNKINNNNLQNTLNINNNNNNLSKEDNFNLLKDKINNLNEQNNFLTIRLNNLNNANNALMKKIEFYYSTSDNITNINSINNEDKAKISELNKANQNLKLEIKNIIEERNNIYIENQKLRFEIKNKENQTNNNTPTINHFNNNISDNKNYLDLYKKFTEINLLLQDKQIIIKNLENSLKYSNLEKYNLINIISDKEEIIKNNEKHLINLNKDLIFNKIENNEIKENNINIENLNENKLNKLDEYNCNLYNEKVKTINKNKNEIIQNLQKENNILILQLKEKENLLNLLNEDLNKNKEKINILEYERKNLNFLINKYKLNIL